MMDKELTRIVERALVEALRSNEIVRRPWLTQQIANANIQPSDSEFSKACAYHTIADVLGRVMRKSKDYTEPSTVNGQLSLPGYNRVQTHYAIERDGESCFVAVHLMTDREGAEKVAAMRAQGRGVLEHADELESLFQRRDRTANA